MKMFFLAVALAGLAAGTVQADTMASGPTCLTAYDVDHTRVVNSSILQFYMKNGKIWQSNLPAACPGLNFHGFVIIGHEDELCGGQGISIIQTHQVCQLGKFAAVTPPVSH